MKDKIKKSFSYLKKKIRTPNQFLVSDIGADLWVDGHDAIASTSSLIFNHYLDLFCETHKQINKTSKIHFESFFKTFDLLIHGIPKKDETIFMHVLAVGISTLHSLNGIPKLSAQKHAIVNDTILCLLSTQYRTIRFNAYNDGITIKFVRGKHESFRPELGTVVLGEPFITFNESFPTIQFYNLAHEVGHILFYSDCYLRRYGTKNDTTNLILNAEESLISLDLLMLNEIKEFGIQLHLIEAIENIDTGDYKSLKKTIVKASKDKKQIISYQKALKSFAQNELNNNRLIGDILSRNVRIPKDMFNWFGKRAIKKHIDGAIEISDRLFQDNYYNLLTLIPVNENKVNNVFKAYFRVWTNESIIFDLKFTQPSLKQRQSGKATYALKRKSVKLAEKAGLSKIINQEKYQLALYSILKNSIQQIENN